MTKKCPKYEVLAELSKIPLSKAKNSFTIKSDNNVLGTLKFSIGSIQWYAKNKSKPTRTLNWEKFAELMENQ